MRSQQIVLNAKTMHFVEVTGIAHWDNETGLQVHHCDLVHARHRTPLVHRKCASSTPKHNPINLQVTSRLVELSVAVTNKETHDSVDGLSADNFILSDDGHRHVVSIFEHGQGRQPLSIVFLIESAQSEREVVNRLVETLPNALHVSHKNDRVGVAVVYPGYKIILKPTLDRVAVPNALIKVRDDQVKNLETEHLKNDNRRAKMIPDDLDSALVAISQHNKCSGVDSRLVIAIVTDNLDFLNRGRSADAAKKLLKDRTQVAAFLDVENLGMAYAASYAHVVMVTTPMGITTRDHGAIYYAEQTGGPVVKVEKDTYTAAVKRLLETLSSVYQIGFVPPSSAVDGKCHKLTVKLTTSDKAGHVLLSYRKGYRAIP